MPTPEGIVAANALTTAEAWIELLEIHHTDLAEPIRVARNHADIEHNGNLYIAFPFQFTLPDDDGRKRPVARLVIPDFGEFEDDGEMKTVIDILRAMTTAATVRAIIVLGSDPDKIEAEFDELVLREARQIGDTIECDLFLEDVMNEPYPGDSFTPASHPGLF